MVIKLLSEVCFSACIIIFNVGTKSILFLSILNNSSVRRKKSTN